MPKIVEVPDGCTAIILNADGSVRTGSIVDPNSLGRPLTVADRILGALVLAGPGQNVLPNKECERLRNELADACMKAEGVAPRRNYEVEINYVVGWADEGHGFDDPDLRGGFIIGWRANVGYGQLTFVMRHGRIEMDTEGMSDDFVDQVLAALRKSAVRVG